jgi:YegS/Rv2252/BmrU family lipid kinase
VTAAVVNPRAGRDAARRWSAIARRLGVLETRFTEAPGHATVLARELASTGCDLLIVAGGDGTLNEVVNGIAGRDGLRLGVLPLGSGGEFARTLGLRGVDAAIDTLAAGHARPVDVFRARFAGPDSLPSERLFLNAASVGLGAAVAGKVKQWSRAIPNRPRYLGAALSVLAAGRPLRVRLSVDGAQPATLDITTIAISNGQYQGAGIRIAPEARIDDGLIDVTIVRHVSAGEVAMRLPILYSGLIYTHPKVLHWRGARLSAEADTAAPLELDGEVVGALPLTVDVLPGAIRVIAP